MALFVAGLELQLEFRDSNFLGLLFGLLFGNFDFIP